MHRPTPAGLAWGVILAEAAAVDVVLLRRGQLPLSTVCRRSTLARLVVVALAVHLVASIPNDPLTLLGRAITRTGASET